MTRLLKKYPPNEKALPPLLDPVNEAKRLKSINQRKKEISDETKKIIKAKNTFEKICKGEIK